MEEILLHILPLLGSTVSIGNIILFIYLYQLEKSLKKEREEYRDFRKSTEKRLRRMELFLDKKFSFSSLPGGYK